MPTYSAPNNPDCSITCDGAGAAFYVAPDGPCLRSCGSSALASAFVEILGTRGETSRVGVRIVLDAHATLALASALRGAELSPDIQATARVIQAGIRDLGNPRAFSFEFAAPAITMIDLLREIAASTGLMAASGG